MPRGALPFLLESPCHLAAPATASVQRWAQAWSPGQARKQLKQLKKPRLLLPALRLYQSLMGICMCTQSHDIMMLSTPPTPLSYMVETLWLLGSLTPALGEMRSSMALKR